MTASSLDNPVALSHAFGNAVMCASDDELRPILNCVSIAADADGVKLVATDSHVLCVQELALTSQPRLGVETWDGVWDVMLHRDELDVARSVLSGLKETPIDLERVDEGLLMKVAQREVLLPQFTWDGEFPDWRALMDGVSSAKAAKLLISGWLLKRLGSLRLPNIARDEVAVHLDFAAETGAVRYRLSRDDELKVYGLAMPMTDGSF